jgi:hypothetical protein
MLNKNESEKIYVIRDNQGRYNCSLNIYANSDNGKSDFKWDYFSRTYPTTGNIFRENVELNIMRLQELNELAGYDLTWEVVELTEEESLKLCMKSFELGHKNSSIEMKEIKKGCIGKHRKLVREIYKKYKFMKKTKVA